MNSFRLPLAPGVSVELPVLHEDDALMAVDKPSGLMISPDTYDPEKPNLMSGVRRALDTGAAWVRERGLTMLANVHRLDADTSGVLLLAKTHDALRELSKQFNDRTVGKSYVALVEGEPAEDAFEVELKLGPHPARPWLQIELRHGGKQTLTRFRVLERFRLRALRGQRESMPFLSCTLVACEPETGRTHQIRVHLRHAGYPILCDKVYGEGERSALYLSQLKPGYKLHSEAAERPLLGRLALHAERLAVTHPTTCQRLELVAPLPKDFAVALKYLRKFTATQPGAADPLTPP
ncbi:MAG: RNA pseudouridine synthase [Verrucomicrobia bacterium]|nr:RNA pseudouridine synthase [Verrucomicrobiota bacterium]